MPTAYIKLVGFFFIFSCSDNLILVFNDNSLMKIANKFAPSVVGIIALRLHNEIDLCIYRFYPK